MSPFSLVSGYDSGMYPTVAKSTVALYFNPGQFGTANFTIAQVNIKVNPQVGFIQPNHNFLNPLSDHVFGVIFNGAACTAVKCKDCNYRNLDINPVTNSNIEPGTYAITTNKCYPVCCDQQCPPK